MGNFIRNDNLFKTILTKQGGAGFTKSSDGRTSLDGQYDYDPAVSGYTHVYIDNIPKEMEGFIPGAFKSSTELGYAIAALSREYVLPETNIESVTYSGMAKFQTPGALKTGSELSIRFLDTVDLQLSNFFRAYNQHLRPKAGRPTQSSSKTTSEALHENLLELKGSEWQSKYHMNAVIFSTDPTCGKVTQATSCFGLWPKKNPNEHLSIAIGDVSVFVFTQNFSVSYIYEGTDLIESMQSKLEELVKRDHTIV